MLKNINYEKLTAICIFIITIFIIFYILKIGSFLILPFVIALLISFGIISISGFFSNIGMNHFFSYLFSAFCFFIFFFIVGLIINTNIIEITKTENILKYQEKLDLIITPIIDYLGKFNVDNELIKQKIFTNINISNLFGTITSAITSIISSAGLIIVYILFILLEYRYFKKKIILISSNPIKRAKTEDIMKKIKNDVKAYFNIKTITSLLTGIFSYIILLIFDVDFALFWAFLIFFLNFIPTVGSIIAVCITSFFAVIQFSITLYFLSLVTLLIGVQILIGNILEPKLMGSKLNLSPLVILLSLGLWGSIWGIIGMLLAVPLMVIINIILAKFELTKSISILLSEKGYIESSKKIKILKSKNNVFKILKNKINL